MKHPGGSFAYKTSYNGKSAIIATDSEITEKIRNIDTILKQLIGHDWIGCFKNVWGIKIGSTPIADNENIQVSNKNEIKDELFRNRKDKCFFFEYHEHMDYKAAEELQKRNAENATLKKSLFRMVPKRYKENVKRQFFKKVDLAIGEEEKSLLAETYREDIIKLQQLIKKDLNHWLES